MQMPKAATGGNPPTREERETASVAMTRPEIHEILSNERRSYLLELLVAESPRELSELAEAIAAAEAGEEPPPRNIRQSVYVSLHQSHLPKLTEVGFVEYDETEKVVTITDAAISVLDPSPTEGVDRGDEGGDRKTALAVVVAGLLLSLASTAGLWPLSGLAPSTYAIGTLLTLLVVFTYGVVRDGGIVATRF